MKYIFLLCFVYLSSNAQTFNKVRHKNIKIMNIRLDSYVSFYSVVKINDITRNKDFLVSIPTQYLGFYYHDIVNCNTDEQSKYLKYMKNLLKGKPIMVNDSNEFNNRFREYIVEKNIYLEIKKKPFDSIIIEYFDNDFKEKVTLDKRKHNAVVKILYDQNIGICQDDYTGNYYIDKTPLIKSILKK